MIALAAPPAIVSQAKCHEDMACWSWSTMGNHKRGLRTISGRFMVVGPCAFRRLVLSKHYDVRSQPLRGDRWAIRYGCRS